MQLKNTYQLRKKHENDFVKYKDLKRDSITVKLVLGTVMHRVDLTFTDGNNFRLTLHKVGDDIVLAFPKMWEYSLEKLAVLDYLTNIVFFNDSYTIIEDVELYTPEDNIDYYKVVPSIISPSTYKYSIHTDSFHESHFSDFDVRIVHKVAKVFKFKTEKVS